jgi:pyrimidine deaminase RibD-like protein
MEKSEAASLQQTLIDGNRPWARGDAVDLKMRPWKNTRDYLERMTSDMLERLVTIGGQCFEAEFEGEYRYPTRDGVFYNFRLKDLKSAGTRLVALWRFGPIDPFPADFASRIEAVRLNTIRRAFDSGKLNLDPPFDEAGYRELELSAADFKQHPPVSDEEISQFIKNQAYWLSWKFGNRYPIQFDGPIDQEYLGVDALKIQSQQWLLEQRRLLEQSAIRGVGRPTANLIDLFQPKPITATGDRVGIGSTSSESADWKFARMAIEEARKSVAEDERIHPKVGAVVVKDGEILALAHRGEVPECHAEYMALEKKLKDASLLGATVYTTLEPCTERSDPKVPCANRLAERKVDRVVLGMLDPDTRVRGLGQMTLREAGIVTDFFPPDLMTEVEELNRDFIRDRKSRASRPKGQVHFVPDAFNCGWAKSTNDQMEVRLGGTFTYDGTRTLTVLKAFVEGTQPVNDMLLQVIASRGLGATVTLPHLDLIAHSAVRAFINVRVAPVRGIPGQAFNGHVVFRDNYNRDYLFEVSLPYIGQR